MTRRRRGPYHRPIDDLPTTRTALHAVSEHVLAAARYAVTGRIGLRPVPGGFGTPAFPHGDVTRSVWVVGATLQLRDDEAVVASAPLSTLRAAGELVGVEPCAPVDVYPPATSLDLDQPLAVDPGAAAVIAEWFALCDQALASLVADDGTASDVQLWPEHFDLATTIDEVNYGGSPGDDAHDEPYLYVGPWSVPEGPFWNEPFGASRSRSDMVDAEAALAFFREGRAEVGSVPPALKAGDGRRQVTASDTATAIAMTATGAAYVAQCGTPFHGGASTAQPAMRAGDDAAEVTADRDAGQRERDQQVDHHHRAEAGGEGVDAALPQCRRPPRPSNRTRRRTPRRERVRLHRAAPRPIRRAGPRSTAARIGPGRLTGSSSWPSWNSSSMLKARWMKPKCRNPDVTRR